MPARETSIYDGVDPTLTGLADYPGRGARRLRKDLEEIKTRCAEALQSYRVENPVKAAKPILEGLALLKELRANLAGEGLDPRAAKAIGVYLARRLRISKRSRRDVGAQT